MSEERTRKREPRDASKLDINVNDVVQIRFGESAGRVGVVIGSCLRRDHNGEPFILYYVKLSDNESTSAAGTRLRVVRRAADDGEI